MISNRLQRQDGTGQKLIEDIIHLNGAALGEGAAMCQVCGCGLGEGDGVTAYAFRAAGNPIFEIGFVMCGADEHEHPSVFTRGVHELVVTGRIGLCTDVSTQSSWLVLLEPSPVVTSGASSSAARIVSEDTPRDDDTQNIDTDRRDGPMPLLSAVHEQARLDGGGR
jgi:hypothetical protein